MAQTTSALWQELFRMQGTVREYEFEINGVRYGSDAEVEHSVQQSLYEEFGIGNAITATLTLNLYADDIPRGTVIKRFIRLRNEDRVSEWLPKGVFFTNRRSVDKGYWHIEAYDAMCKSEQEYVGSVDEGNWPRPMRQAAEEIAGRMGVEIDPRTVIIPSYNLEYAGGYTMRQVLEHIAAAHGGNWIITDEGKLHLISLMSMPPETNYLVTEHGDAITFGGVRILVG